MSEPHVAVASVIARRDLAFMPAKLLISTRQILTHVYDQMIVQPDVWKFWVSALTHPGIPT